MQFHAAEREVAHSVRTYYEVFIDYSSSLFFLTLEDELPYLVQSAGRFLAVVAVRTASPESFLIELQFFPLCAAIFHSAHSGVSYRHSFEPAFGRLAVPEQCAW